MRDHLPNSWPRCAAPSCCWLASWLPRGRPPRPTTTTPRRKRRAPLQPPRLRRRRLRRPRGARALPARRRARSRSPSASSISTWCRSSRTRSGSSGDGVRARREQEVVVDVERLQIAYRWSDALRLTAGRGHTALGYWNESYHHGKLLQPTVERPEVLKFEDDGGILPVHFVGLEAARESGLRRLGPRLRGLRGERPRTAATRWSRGPSTRTAARRSAAS